MLRLVSNREYTFLLIDLVVDICLETGIKSIQHNFLQYYLTNITLGDAVTRAQLLFRQTQLLEGEGEQPPITLAPSVSPSPSLIAEVRTTRIVAKGDRGKLGGRGGLVRGRRRRERSLNLAALGGGMNLESRVASSSSSSAFHGSRVEQMKKDATLEGCK